MSDIVGFELEPQPETSLLMMVEFGLLKFADKLEEIGASAAKEYSLEKALERMKFEWKDMLFELIDYRDTGAKILSAIDEIQLLLDDHIVKAQTMRGSPFIKVSSFPCLITYYLIHSIRNCFLLIFKIRSNFLR
jgi:dynein heavy chain